MARSARWSFLPPLSGRVPQCAGDLIPHPGLAARRVCRLWPPVGQGRGSWSVNDDDRALASGCLVRATHACEPGYPDQGTGVGHAPLRLRGGSAGQGTTTWGDWFSLCGLSDCPGSARIPHGQRQWLRHRASRATRRLGAGLHQQVPFGQHFVQTSPVATPTSRNSVLAPLGTEEHRTRPASPADPVSVTPVAMLCADPCGHARLPSSL